MVIPEEINESRSFLELADKENDPIAKLGFLQDGFDLLESYLDDCLNQNKDLANNLKKTHALNVLNQLNLLQNIEMGIWLKYFLFFNDYFKFEIERGIQQDEDFGECYKKFEDFWIGIFKKILIKDILLSKNYKQKQKTNEFF